MRQIPPAKEHMANFKGSGILVLQALLKNKGNGAEALFLKDLAPDLAKLYKTCLPAAWVPIDAAVELTSRAADVLYPELKPEERLFKIGYDRAHHQIKGIYRIFFPLLTISVILDNAAKLWSTQHDQGRAWIEKNSDQNSGALCVADYPGMLPKLRIIVKGFMTGVLELGGAKDVRITLDESDPKTWKWKTSWS